MGKQYRTARGQLVDMESLAIANEKTIASGNMGVNAKGDKVKGGKVVQTAAERVAPYHKARKETVSGSVRPRVKAQESATEEETRGTIKQREDGSQYEEIVAEDGSIETREVKTPPKKKKTAAQRNKDASI